MDLILITISLALNAAAWYKIALMHTDMRTLVSKLNGKVESLNATDIAAQHKIYDIESKGYELDAQAQQLASELLAHEARIVALENYASRDQL